MKKQFRLARNEDFQRVRREGRSWSVPSLVLQTSPSSSPYSRLGLVVSKRVGKAVVRNHVRRLLREAVRSRWADIRPGWDIVLIARLAAAGADFWQLSAAVDLVLERASLLSTERSPDQASTAK